MVETRSTSNKTVPKMSTSSSDSPDGAMLTQQSFVPQQQPSQMNRSVWKPLNLWSKMTSTTYWIPYHCYRVLRRYRNLEETVNEIKEMQQKLEPVVIVLISGLQPDEQYIMSREHSRLKIDIKQILTLFRKHIKVKKTPLQQTSSVGSSLNSNENIETHDNTLSHLKQRRTHFVFDDTLSTDPTTQSNTSAPAANSRFVSYGYTAPGGTTPPVNNTSFTRNLRYQLHPAVHHSNRSQFFLADFHQLITTHLDKIALFQ